MEYFFVVRLLLRVSYDFQINFAYAMIFEPIEIYTPEKKRKISNRNMPSVKKIK